MSDHSLPPRPSLASVKKQAKQLLRLHRNDSDSVRARIQEHHPRPDRFAVLADAQLVVAREYGFASWRRLSEHIEELVTASRTGEVEQFLDLACLTYGNDSTARIDSAKQMLAAQPSLAATDVHTAAATATVGALRRLLDEDPGRVSATGGPRNWPPLLYLCYSRVTEHLAEADAVATARLLLEHGADPNAHFMWGGTYRFTALTGAMGEGEGGVVSQPPHAHAWALATLLLDAGADPNDAQGLYNTIFRPRQPLAQAPARTRSHRRGPDQLEDRQPGRDTRLHPRSRGLQGVHRTSGAVAPTWRRCTRHQLLRRAHPLRERAAERLWRDRRDAGGRRSRAGRAEPREPFSGRLHERRRGCRPRRAPGRARQPERRRLDHAAGGRVAGQRCLPAVHAESRRRCERRRGRRHHRPAPGGLARSAGSGRGVVGGGLGGSGRGRTRCRSSLRTERAHCATPTTNRPRPDGPTTPATRQCATTCSITAPTGSTWSPSAGSRYCGGTWRNIPASPPARCQRRRLAAPPPARRHRSPRTGGRRTPQGRRRCRGPRWPW